MRPALVVLAAGAGSRYGGRKQMESVGPGGEWVLDYSVYDALRGGFGKLVFVIRRDFQERFRRSVSGKYEDQTDVRYVLQELDRIPDGFAVPSNRVKPWGTGHAVLMAEGQIEEPFAVVNADDFYGRNAFEVMAGYLERVGVGTNGYAMVGYILRDTLSEHGEVARGICECDSDGKLARVVELTRILKRSDGASYTDESGQTHFLTGDEVVSMNFWGFTPSIFDYLAEELESFLRDHIDDVGAELYIPTVVDRLIHRHLAKVEILPSRDTWYGITYREDKRRLAEGIRDLIRQGVYPAKLWK